MQVGDVLQVVKDSFFPADLLLLAVPDNADGLAYVETINLDGESNLKIKKALDQTQHIRVDTMQHFTVTLGSVGMYNSHCFVKSIHISVMPGLTISRCSARHCPWTACNRSHYASNFASPAA